jgi:heparanase
VATDFTTLAGMLREIWGEADAPRLLGPDTTFDAAWYRPFLAGAAGGMAAVNVHLYALGAGVSPDLQAKILSPLDKHIATAQQTATNLSKVAAEHPGLQMWMGEDGGAYNSGQNGTTNRYIAGFWSLNELGLFARAGFSGYCRQTLLGGNYGLLDKDTLLPNPDFFNYMLFKRLMGARVLDVAAQGKKAGNLTVYAHCAAPGAGGGNGGVTVLLVNFDATSGYRLAAIGDGAGADLLAKGKERQEYILTSPGAINGSVSYLNGAPLRLTASGDYPPLEPRVVVNGQEELVIPPLTYGFVVFPDAEAKACA